jgi:predicted dehydrogenase
VSDVVKAKQYVAAGEVGEVILFENAFTSRVDMTNRWNSDPAVSGGGVLIDNGTHSVDVIRYFLGPLAEVHAVEGLRVQPLRVEDTAKLFVRSSAGVLGTVDLSWSINKELDWYVKIFGTRGVINIGWKQSRIKRDGGDWEIFGNGYEKVQAFTAQVTNVAKAVRGEEELLITAADAIASVEVIEAAYHSLRSAAWTGVSAGNPLTQTPPSVKFTDVVREVERV